MKCSITFAKKKLIILFEQLLFTIFIEHDEKNILQIKSNEYCLNCITYYAMSFRDDKCWSGDGDVEQLIIIRCICNNLKVT